ncbi:hypothetical protein RUND412_000653 [Rhizina undulata]
MSQPTRIPGKSLVSPQDDCPRAPETGGDSPSTSSRKNSNCPFLSLSKTSDDVAVSRECPFCAIASVFPPVRPSLVSPEPSLNEDPLIFPQAHIVLSTENVLAFLDIQPSTKAHVLVCPRRHVVKVSDMRSWENLSVGAWLPIVARAVIKVTGVEDFNVIQNNGVNAAQVVPHVHYHIIPRPRIGQRDTTHKVKSKHGHFFSSREDLDDEEGAVTARDMRMAIAQELEEMKKNEAGNGERKLLASL